MVRNKKSIIKELEEKNMSITVSGAETPKIKKVLFISKTHEKFYYEKLKEVRYQDIYHKALCYFLGISLTQGKMLTAFMISRQAM